MAHEARKSMEKDDDGMLTREEKEALLDRKIQMMKLKNEERMKKFREIEEDKKWAEREGRAVSLKNSSTFNDDDDSWPLRTDRFTEETPEEQTDLRKVLQQRRGETRTTQDQPPVTTRQSGSSRYASILDDGPPPDPAYNYLADHERDKPIGEKMRRGPRGHLNPRNNVVRGNRPRNDQFSGQPHKYNGDGNVHKENTVGYDHWRKERENIDRERIERQKTNEGWKREWDRDKGENQEERRSDRQVGHQSLEEPPPPHVLPSSGDSYSRGTSYRGGRGRGRPKQDLQGSSPRAGLTPDREFGTTVQEPPPRFRRSPEDSRPGANALAQANARGSSAGNSPRNWPNAQRPATSVQSQQQWPKPRADLQTSMPDSEVIASSRNTDFSPRSSTVITVVKRPQAENVVQPIVRVIQNGAPNRQERSIQSEVELHARDQFVKSPKKGIGSGRLLPPSKERVASRGKSANTRKIVTAKGKRPGSRWVEKDDEPVTIGIAVITTPGDKEENVAKVVEGNSGEASPVVEDKHPDVIPPRKDISRSESITRQIEFVDDEADNYDDDDDEWEDIDGSWADVDEKMVGEHNKSNESIDRFIEENTLHPDGTNWNIDDDDTDTIPWSEQVDAESQERHHMENEWVALKQRPSDSNLDYSFQSSCSIVESPLEEPEILSSLLAAACDPFAKEELDLKPGYEESCPVSEAGVARDPSNIIADPSDTRPHHEPSTLAAVESCSESSKAAEPISNDLQQGTTVGLPSETQPSSSLADINLSAAVEPAELPLQSVFVEPSNESQFPLVVTEQPNLESSIPAEVFSSGPDSSKSALPHSNNPDLSAVFDAKAMLSAVSEPSFTTDPSDEACAMTSTQFAASSVPAGNPYEPVTLDLSAMKPDPDISLTTGKVDQSASEMILSQSEGLESHSEEVICQSVGSALRSVEETSSPESSNTDEKSSEVQE